MIAWCSGLQVFLHRPLNTAIIQVLGCSGSARPLTVRFTPRPLNFNIFEGDMHLPASLISFVASFISGRKGLMTMNSSLSGSMALCEFKPFPPDPPDPVGFLVGT